MKKIYFFVKRLFDIVLCSFALIILSPIFLITGVAIKLSSPGPVFYLSKRGGLLGKPFNFYKFRSMHVTDNDKGMCVADSERLFTVGKIIRRLKIDELPQLINVIKGDMSIVGPRPMIAESVNSIYCGKYECIKSVKPGLTSVASLFDYSVGDTYTDDDLYVMEVIPKKLEMELFYVQHMSLRYDTELVIRTMVMIVQAVFCRKRLMPVREYQMIGKG